MRSLILIGSVVVGAACSRRGENPPREEPGGAPAIFREIDVRPLPPLMLGAPLDPLLGHTAPVAPGLFVLRIDGRGGFGGTDSLLVRVDAENRVASLHFVYPAGQDYAAMLGEFEASLGPPTERVTSDSVGGRIERVAWEDARTRFELTRFRALGQVPKVTSAMIDRAGRR